MPCTTYLSNGEYTKPTRNKMLNELLTKVRERTGEDWRIAERQYTAKRFLRKSIDRCDFELYVGLGGTPLGIEFQIINFYRDHDWTINHSNSAEHVAAYLYGMLAGMHQRYSKGSSEGTSK